MSLWDWPALSRRKGFISIDCERAIHGKPDSSTRDFDYVAVSQNFTEKIRGLERFFVVKNQPGRIPLWWQTNDRYYASFNYPSRLSDRTGRPGLETQILEWSPQKYPNIPPALAALLMLRKVATLSDQEWIDAARDPRFQDPRFVLTPKPLQLQASEGELENMIRDAAADLCHIPSAMLQRFYAHLIAATGSPGPSPALLTGLDAPLSARALAALLLPAPPGKAATWHLAGWPTELAQWHGIACRKAPDNTTEPPPPSVDDEQRGVMMAYAIQNNAPARVDLSEEVKEILAFARGVQRHPDAEKMIARKETTISEPEAQLIEQAAHKVADSPVPEYMAKADPEVTKAFHQEMLLKAEYIKAWRVLLSAPASRDWKQFCDFSPRWIELEGEETSDGWIKRILEQWKASSVARDRLNQIFPSTR